MNKSRQHILVIDDDREITLLLSDYLQQHGYKVTSMHDGLRLKSLLTQQHVDLAILDVMLPGPDGLRLCQSIRKNYDFPIIMLSAAHSEADRVAGLELGADDYVAKPFSARELLARIKSQLRRASGDLPSQRRGLDPLAKLKFAHCTLDRETHCIIGEDEVAISLSQREYDLLTIFAEHPKRILSRDQLTDLLYDKPHTPYDRSIDVMIARLRKKIELDAKKPQILLTVRGGGYQFNTEVESIR